MSTIFGLSRKRFRRSDRRRMSAFVWTTKENPFAAIDDQWFVELRGSGDPIQIPLRDAVEGYGDPLFPQYAQAFQVPNTVPAGTYAVWVSAEGGAKNSGQTIQVLAPADERPKEVWLSRKIEGPVIIDRRTVIRSIHARVEFGPKGRIWFLDGAGTIECTVINVTFDGWSMDIVDDLDPISRGVFRDSSGEGDSLAADEAPVSWPVFDVDIVATGCVFDGISPGIVNHHERNTFLRCGPGFGPRQHGQSAQGNTLLGQSRYAVAGMYAEYLTPWSLALVNNHLDDMARAFWCDALALEGVNPVGLEGMLYYMNRHTNLGRTFVNGSEQFLVEISAPGIVQDLTVVANDFGGRGSSVELWEVGVNRATFAGNGHETGVCYWFYSETATQTGIRIDGDTFSRASVPLMLVSGIVDDEGQPGGRRHVGANGIVGPIGVVVHAAWTPGSSVDPDTGFPFPGDLYVSPDGVFGDGGCATNGILTSTTEE